MDRPRETSSKNPVVRDNFYRAIALLDANANDHKAISLLRRNSFFEDPDSMVLLGTLYMNGNPDERDESIALFRKAADMGNSSAMRNMGYCYAVGMNVRKDKTAAVLCYRQAMDAGNAAAACNLGVMYDYGNGTEQNFEKAFQCYLFAAEHGNTRGMTNLGEYYVEGKGTEVDYDEAEKWFTASGSPRAKHRLALLYLDCPQKRNRMKGLEILKESADEGYGKAMVRYGDEKSGEVAADYYTRAAAKGNPDAIARLKERGLPVPEPIPKRRKKSS